MEIRSYIRVVSVAVGAFALFIASAAPAFAEWHVVAAGETLWQIGEQYGVDAAAIAGANGIDDPALIYIGEELWVPVDGEPFPESGAGSIVHVVSAGETIATIAGAYGVDTVELATINGIESPYVIFPGQQLQVPYVEQPVPPTPAPPTAPGSINPEIPFVERDVIRSYVIQIAEAYGWDPYLILSLAWRESTWDQRALSTSGAVGVMQLMPATADWAGPALVGYQTDYLYNAWENIETGIAYLTHLRAQAGSDYLALAGYFQGLASVERDGIFPATREYALGIIQSRDLFESGALP